MLNFAFSPEIKHKQRPFERCLRLFLRPMLGIATLGRK